EWAPAIVPAGADVDDAAIAAHGPHGAPSLATQLAPDLPALKTDIIALGVALDADRRPFGVARRRCTRLGRRHRHGIAVLDRAGTPRAHVVAIVTRIVGIVVGLGRIAIAIQI